MNIAMTVLILILHLTYIVLFIRHRVFHIATR